MLLLSLFCYCVHLSQSSQPDEFTSGSVLEVEGIPVPALEFLCCELAWHLEFPEEAGKHRLVGFVLMVIWGCASSCAFAFWMERCSSVAVVMLWSNAVDRWTVEAFGAARLRTTSQTLLHAHTAPAAAPYQSTSGAHTTCQVLHFIYISCIFIIMIRKIRIVMNFLTCLNHSMMTEEPSGPCTLPSRLKYTFPWSIWKRVGSVKAGGALKVRHSTLRLCPPSPGFTTGRKFRL